MATSVFPGLSPLAREHTSLHAGNPADCGLSAGAGNTLQDDVRGLFNRFIPLAREHANTNPAHIPPDRFIPAGAGNTQLGGSGFYFCCGLSPLAREHSHCSIWGLTTGGLSPLAREHPCSGVNITCGRFIPAGAGNTPAVLAAHYSTPVYPRWRGNTVY
ncbi:hypothetical protein IU399_16120 [Salmonella enterica subsp. enterica serovar Worthington]|nr:hypothetical protein [Salmonella enterica subsp. enterica serovar Worthington]